MKAQLEKFMNRFSTIIWKSNGFELEIASCDIDYWNMADDILRIHMEWGEINIFLGNASITLKDNGLELKNSHNELFTIYI